MEFFRIIAAFVFWIVARLLPEDFAADMIETLDMLGAE